MSDTVKRAIRTFVQGFLGFVVTSGVLSAVAAQGVVDFSVLRKVVVSAVAAAAAALVAFVMNALENSTGADIIPK